MQLDFATKEVTIKLVYYGPALSGKTTNLQKLHARVAEGSRGRLLMLDTHADRTLFFDLLPIHFRSGTGVAVKLKLFTVPGQVMHNATRKVVLQGADGVAFIADSQLSEKQTNNDAWANLRENLAGQGLEPDRVPTVIQFNKRDLPVASIRSDDEIAKLALKGREPVFKAAAIRGEGVLQTFLGLVKLTWDDLERRYQIEDKLGLPADTFLAHVRTHFGLAPAGPPSTPPGPSPSKG